MNQIKGNKVGIETLKGIKEVGGFKVINMDELKINGVDPAKAMRNFERWVREAAGHDRPVFVAFNATFDWWTC